MKQGLVAYYNAITTIIISEQWRRRKYRKHEGIQTSDHKNIMNVTKNMFMLLKVRKPKRNFPNNWRGILKDLVTFIPFEGVKGHKGITSI